MYDDDPTEDLPEVIALQTEPLNPGTLSFAQQELVEQAVDDTNAAVAQSRFQLATIVRDLVIGRFFGGDYSRFADRNPTKEQTFAAFVRHKRLVVGDKTVYYLVRVGEQARHLRSEVAQWLPFSHHKLMLPIKDATVREQLAERAFDGQWTVEDMTHAVQPYLEQPPERAPPRTQPVVIESLRATRNDLLKKVTPERLKREWPRMTPAQQAKAEAWVDELEARARDLRAALRDLTVEPQPEPKP